MFAKIRKKYAVILTEHGRKRIKERVMSQENYRTSDEMLLADMAFKKGKHPKATFRKMLAGRPPGFDGFRYKHYGNMIYCFGLLDDKNEAHLLTVYFDDVNMYHQRERLRYADPCYTRAIISSNELPMDPIEENGAPVEGAPAEEPTVDAVEESEAVAVEVTPADEESEDPTV